MGLWLHPAPSGDIDLEDLQAGQIVHATGTGVAKLLMRVWHEGAFLWVDLSSGLACDPKTCWKVRMLEPGELLVVGSSWDAATSPQNVQSQRDYGQQAPPNE